MINEYDIELIDKYLLDQLTESELSEFELRLNDNEFSSELSIMKEIKNQVIDLGRMDLKNKINQVFIKSERSKVKIIPLSSIFKYSIAASFLLAISISSYAIVRTNSKKAIYYSHSGGASKTHKVTHKID